MSKQNSTIARMQQLMTYGTINENKKPNSIEYSIEASDGKIYSVIRENAKYFIKTAPKGKENLLENYDFIGGWNNHTDYEYDSYNNALKQLELKVRSINEANGSNATVETLNPDKKQDLMVEATEGMRKSIERYREIMNNVAHIMNESSEFGKTSVPEAPKTTSFNSKLGKPFDQTATAELHGDLKKTASSPEKQGEPFGDGKKSECCKDAEYVPDNSVANKKPSGGKVVKVNEDEEKEWDVLPSAPGTGSSEGHLMEDDDFEDYPAGFENDSNIELGNEPEYDESEEEEPEIDLDDPDFGDEESEDEEPELDSDLDDEDDLEDSDLGDEDDLEDSDLEDEDDLDDEINFDDYDLDDPDSLEELISKLQDKADSLEGNEDDEIDLGDEDDLEDSDLDNEDDLEDSDLEDEDDLDDEETPDFDEEDSDDDLEEESFDLGMNESKRRTLNNIVENVVNSLTNKKRINEEKTVLHNFGKHPGYRKKPMSLPQTGSDTEGQNRDWNDDSVHNEQPFGQRIGSSAPYGDAVSKAVEDVITELKKKL